MLLGKRVTVIMPVYNAEKTLEQTYAEIPHDIVDHIIIVDDCSKDRTVEIAQQLGIDVIQHDTNKGYGGNQKTCYQRACALNSDVVVIQ